MKSSGNRCQRCRDHEAKRGRGSAGSKLHLKRLSKGLRTNSIIYHSSSVDSFRNQLPRMAGNPSDGGSTTREGQKRPLHAEVQSLGVRTWMSRSPPPNVIVLEPRGLKTSRKILVIAKKGSCQGSCQLWAKSNQPLQSRTGQNMDTHASQANGSSLMV